MNPSGIVSLLSFMSVIIEENVLVGTFKGEVSYLFNLILMWPRGKN